ncbi:hypothetical protein KIN20_027105 [Parelaphostrongylus tenuis]|uniref:Uncharacterized protein n=1 Tax=Parelaphostrongylus tenuis TaxID=148309 RepID=A0AAD5WDP8_PARTN|nr:hypothetical protein KIN20_027105 [Parelaphostrongylus tenuis]
MMRTCVVVGNTVTTTCPPLAAGAARGPAPMCTPADGMNFMPIDPQHLSTSGTLTTSNIIMANWNRDMWESVVNRVLRMLASGPFGTHFVAAVATVT